MVMAFIDRRLAARNGDKDDLFVHYEILQHYPGINKEPVIPKWETLTP